MAGLGVGVLVGQLGHLIWWRVGEIELDHDTLAGLLEGTGVSGPPRPNPADVFRRVTGKEVLKSYPLETDTLECTLAPVESKTDSVLMRHMVGTVKNSAGVVQLVRKIGDVAFYRPPRRQPSKARLRVVPGSDLYPSQAEDFARFVRAEYDNGVKGALDGQAIRRVVRLILAEEQAVYLGGTYFVEHLQQGEVLRALFERLGDDSFMHVVKLEDTPEHRQVVWGEAS